VDWRIPRENLIINKHTRTCIQHFDERFSIRTMELRRPVGSLRIVQRLGVIHMLFTDSLLLSGVHICVWTRRDGTELTDMLRRVTSCHDRS